MDAGRQVQSAICKPEYFQLVRGVTMPTINNCGRHTNLRFDGTQSSEPYPPNVGQGPWCNFSAPPDDSYSVWKISRAVLAHKASAWQDWVKVSLVYLRPSVTGTLMIIYKKCTTGRDLSQNTNSLLQLQTSAGGRAKEGLVSRILWKVWDIWLPSSIYMTPDSNYRQPHLLWRSQKPLLSLCPQTQSACA